MAKRVTKGFAAKNEKALSDSKNHCSVCGESIEMVKHIVTIGDEKANNVRFREKIERVCKCNKTKIFK